MTEKMRSDIHPRFYTNSLYASAYFPSWKIFRRKEQQKFKSTKQQKLCS